MYLAELVEVAIGLVVVYFLVSMASSQVLEWFSQVLQWRSRDLEAAIRGMVLNQSVEPRMFGGVIQGVRQLLKGKTPEKPQEAIIRKLYDHPLIKPLSGRTSVLGKIIKPANIPSRAFALALFDTVMTAGTEASRIHGVLAAVRNQVGQLPTLDPEVKKKLDALIEQAVTAVELNEQIVLDNLKGELVKFAEAHPDLKPLLDGLLHMDPKMADAALYQFKHALLGLSANNLDLKRTLESLISGAESGEGAIAAVRTNVETWFNTNMDQLTDLYKRRSKLWAGVIAFILAVILNVDTFVIATTLWREPTLRQAIVANAEKLQPPPTPVVASTATSTISLTQTISSTQPVSPTVTVNDLKQQLEGLQLPIGGWQVGQLAVSREQCAIVPLTKNVWGIWWNGACKVLFLKDRQPGLSGFLAKLAGWLITALAAAQGAPFWFDLLNKLLQLRGTGKKPEEQTATA